MQRVTIKDIAEELGLSTATVSNVIHGKTKKISDRTVAKVQEKLESSGYIPNMAAVLLAQNTSQIICVALSDDQKYQGHMVEDPFVSGMLNGLAKELDHQGYFMMLKLEPDWKRIEQYASMWNMAGLIMIGYCETDYQVLRSKMHIPFVVVDAYTKNTCGFSDIGIDNIQGGMQAGEYLYGMGHRHILYLADNEEDCDLDRYVGMKEALHQQKDTTCREQFCLISEEKKKRLLDYDRILRKYIAVDEVQKYTAAFVASDYYAIEFMQWIQEHGIQVPQAFSIIGFDGIPMGDAVNPGLTTIGQNIQNRAQAAVEALLQLIRKESNGEQRLLPVSLIERNSVSKRQID